MFFRTNINHPSIRLKNIIASKLKKASVARINPSVAPNCNLPIVNFLFVIVFFGSLVKVLRVLCWKP